MARVAGWITVVLTLVVLAAAVCAGLSLAAGWDSRLDLLSHFAVAYAAVGAVGLLWAVVAGRGPLVAVSILALVASFVLIRPELARDAGPVAPADAPGQIKVIQINTLRTNTDIARVADWLVAQDPDVVTVAEARKDLRDLLVKRTGWKTAGGRGTQMIFTARRYDRMVRPKLPRGATLNYVNATYSLGGAPVEVVTTHLDWPTEPVAAGQRSDLISVAARRPRARMILTGDFNATPWSQALRELDTGLGLTRRGRGAPTWPAQVAGVRWPVPFLSIDHVYAGPGWATVKVERGPWLGSDHYPLVVILAPVR